jgi:hypothetical protein
VSAPVSHHPLVVNTADGSCWTRRAVTSDGRGLYALAGSVAGVPDEVLVSLADLAELGIIGSAFALPVPVGPVLRSELDQARDDVVGACLARWEEEQDNARLRLALASAKRGRSQLRARVTELLAERHSTNEALDDAVQALRTDRAEPAKGPSAAESADPLTRLFAPTQALRVEAEKPGACDACGSLPERWCPDCAACEKGCHGGHEANSCTHANAPWSVRVPREDPHDGPLAHSYRVGRDLPETGGAR